MIMSHAKKNVELRTMYIMTTTNIMSHAHKTKNVELRRKCTRWQQKHDYVTCRVTRHGHGYTLLSSDVYKEVSASPL